MSYDRELIAHKLRRWEKYLNDFTLPRWEEIPDLGLYMDQVILFLTQYLSFLPREDGPDSLITASTINNYVRTKVMPAPTRKKYRRVHIAYLIMICTLKQSLSISHIQRIIPLQISEDEVRAIYENYAERHKQSAEFFISQMRENAREVLDGGGQSEDPVGSLVMAASVISGFARLMSEKIIKLQDITLAEVLDAGEGPEDGAEERVDGDE